MQGRRSRATPVPPRHSTQHRDECHDERGRLLWVRPGNVLFCGLGESDSLQPRSVQSIVQPIELRQMRGGQVPICRRRNFMRKLSLWFVLPAGRVSSDIVRGWAVW